MRNKKAIIVITAVFLLVAIIGVTYAYFTATITGNESAENIIVSTGNYHYIMKKDLL